MNDALEILYWVGASHLALFAAHLLLWKRRIRAARYGAGFALGLLGFLLLQLGLSRGWPGPILLLLAVGLSAFPFFFWMLSLELFRERFRPGPRWLVLPAKILVTLVAAPRAGTALLDLQPWLAASGLEAPDEQAFLRLLPSALFSSALIVLALREALRGYSDDLIEERRRLRRVFLAACGGAVLASVSLRLAMQSPELQQLHNLLVCTLTIGLSYCFFLAAYDFRLDLLGEGESATQAGGRAGAAPDSRAVATSALSPADRELQRRLEALLEGEKYYREEGLTIRRLAAKLDAHEYRLRRLINAGLGFRNFNDFLNRYRVQEACELLASDPERTIVRISLDLGYRSPGSFNKAFRDLTGKTPSEYRREAGASDA